MAGNHVLPQKSTFSNFLATWWHMAFLVTICPLISGSIQSSSEEFGDNAVWTFKTPNMLVRSVRQPIKMPDLKSAI